MEPDAVASLIRGLLLKPQSRPGAGKSRWCSAGLLLSESLGRQLAQLVIHQRKELLGGLRVALIDRAQDAGDVAHQAVTW
jgi:hypothetical protein